MLPRCRRSFVSHGFLVVDSIARGLVLLSSLAMHILVTARVYIIDKFKYWRLVINRNIRYIGIGDIEIVVV